MFQMKIIAKKTLFTMACFEITWWTNFSSRSHDTIFMRSQPKLKPQKCLKFYAFWSLRREKFSLALRARIIFFNQGVVKLYSWGIITPNTHKKSCFQVTYIHGDFSTKTLFKNKKEFKQKGASNALFSGNYIEKKRLALRAPCARYIRMT